MQSVRLQARDNHFIDTAVLYLLYLELETINLDNNDTRTLG